MQSKSSKKEVIQPKPVIKQQVKTPKGFTYTVLEPVKTEE